MRLDEVEQGPEARMIWVHPNADVDPTARLGERTRVWHLAQVREGAVIGRDCILGRGTYVGPGVRLGNNCKVQNQALIYEPAVLEDGVFIGPAAVLTNDRNPRAVTPGGALKAAADWEAVGVVIQEGASIGAHAVCVAPVTVGSLGTFGVVTQDHARHGGDCRRHPRHCGRDRVQGFRS